MRIGLSVRLELQADFFAGVFARYVQKQGLLEEGDIEEA
jgi:predicted metalloprotease